MREFPEPVFSGFVGRRCAYIFRVDFLKPGKTGKRAVE